MNLRGAAAAAAFERDQHARRRLHREQANLEPGAQRSAHDSHDREGQHFERGWVGDRDHLRGDVPAAVGRVDKQAHEMLPRGAERRFHDRAAVVEGAAAQ